MADKELLNNMELKKLKELTQKEILNEEKLTIDFPVFNFDHNDYHEFDDLAENMSRMFNKKIKFIEINHEDYGWEMPLDGTYAAVYYIGLKPTKSQIQMKVDEIAKKKRWSKFEK